MAITTLLNKKINARIAAIKLDASVSELHSYENEITQYPIEDGGQIIDHVRQLPIGLSIDGLVTQTPVVEFTGSTSPDDAEFNSIVRTDQTDVVSVAFNELLKYGGFPTEGNDEKNKDTFELVDVVTGLRVYSNMAIKSISIPRNATTGRSLRFSIQLIQVEKATVDFAELPNVANINNTEPNIKNEAQSTQEKGVVATEKKSLGASISDSLGFTDVVTNYYGL